MVYPHFRLTGALSCEGTMERVLDWKWAPVESASARGRSWIRLDTIVTPGFGRKKEKNRDLFLSTAFYDACMGISNSNNEMN